MRLLPSLPQRLAVGAALSLVGSLVAYVFAWAAVDLGFQWCDERFGPFEKPGCRMAWAT
jgi:hypothetical protein